MNRRDALTGLIVGAGVLVLVSQCRTKNALRYKMVVEVQTPAGMRSGYAVREMSLDTDNIISHNIGSIRGQAIMVALPHNQMLFALLTSGSRESDYAMHIGGRAEVWGKSPSEPRTDPGELFPTAPTTAGLTRTDPLPMLVRFGDIRDPLSVEQVNPVDLAETFGPGYALRTITIQATNEPVSTGIENRLRWLGPSPETSLNPFHGPRDWSLASTLHHGAFRR